MEPSDHPPQSTWRRTSRGVPGNRWDRLRVPKLTGLAAAGKLGGLGTDWEPTARLTVVLPHYEGRPALERTLASLATQTYPAQLTEVLVVDDGSHDPPFDLDGRPLVPDSPVHTRLVALTDQGFGLARARHEGALAATGEIVVFLDHDMLCEPRHLEAHARWHHACDHAVTLGSRQHLPLGGAGEPPAPPPEEIVAAGRDGTLATLFAGVPTSRPVWLERHLARTHDLTSDDDDLFRVVTGGNLGVRRERYLDVGGFDVTFDRWGSEDTDLGYRLFTAGALLVLESAAACWHQGDTGGLEAGERSSLDLQRARLSQQIAHPHFRRIAPGRTFRVPRIVVDVEVADARREAVIATIEDVLASDTADLAVVLSLPDEHPEHLRIVRELEGDARVHLEPQQDHRWSPYRVRMRAGTRLASGSLRRAVEATGVGTIDRGIVRFALDGDQRVTVTVERARGRARWLGALGAAVDDEAARCFGSRDLAGEVVGLGWEPDVELAGLRTVAPAPGAVAADAPPTATSVEARTSGRKASTPGTNGGSKARPPAPTGLSNRSEGAAADAATQPRSRDHVAHLRALQLGPAARFGPLLDQQQLTREGWGAQLDEGADLLLLEPPVGIPGWDPLDGELTVVLQAARAAGIPTVRIHPGRLDATAPGQADLELVEMAPPVRTGELPGEWIAPSVDLGAYNPRGWHPRPPDGVLVLPGRNPDPDATALLERLELHPTLVHHDPTSRPSPIDDAAADPVELSPHHRTYGTERELAASLRRGGVVLDASGWHHGADARWRGWLRALACGTPVVAVADDPLPDARPPGVTVCEPGDIDEVVHRFLADADHRERVSIAGRRWALTDGSRVAALGEILGRLGIRRPPQLRTTVLLSTRRPAFLEHALRSVARQDRGHLDVSLVLHGRDFDGVEVPERAAPLAHVTRAPDAWTLGDCLNAALDHATGELVTKMDDDDQYGRHHLDDLVIAWRHSGAEIVGKRIEYIHLTEQDVTIRREPSRPERDRLHVGGPTLLAARSLLQRFGFLRLVARVDSTLYERVRAVGGRIYATHSRDVILTRHGQAHGHAWGIAPEELERQAVRSAPGCDRSLAGSGAPADW